MSRSIVSSLRLLDQCLNNKKNLRELKAILEKIEKCCAAVEKNLNLADVLNDRGNSISLLKVFGAGGIEIGLQLIFKLAFSGFVPQSFTVKVDIEDRKKIDFLYKSLGAWKQFEIVIALLVPNKEPNQIGLSTVAILNPQREAHWKNLDRIPSGTLVTAYVKMVAGKSSSSQEKLALERIRAIFELVESRGDFESKESAPVLSLRPTRIESNHSKGVSRTGSSSPMRIGMGVGQVAGKLSMSFEVVINKMDTFVHAGNAHLIISHMSNYPGKIELSVVRGHQKVRVSMDQDSIWSAEIRNGETVVYDFYGPSPREDFLKELSNKTNKYTQMDKVANE